MADEIAVRRYAEAFADFAKETIGLDRALQDFKALKRIMRDNPGFVEILHSPQIPYSEKPRLIDKILGEECSKEFIQFLGLLLEKRRIDEVLAIAEYLRANYAHAGKTEALLRTSFPLDLDLVEEIKDKLEKKFNTKLKFYIDLDGDLLGGLQVVIGNKVIDGSVRRRLQDLREKLQTVRT